MPQAKSAFSWPVQLIMAEAAAAGIHRGGMRRQAFSTGDLQALQPAPENAPIAAAPAPLLLSQAPPAAASRAPRLESVPEGSTTALSCQLPALG